MNKSLFIIYIGRIYSAIISIVFVPLVLSLIGAEAYGLVGLFIVLQSCLMIFDAGIGGVLTRQVLLSSHNYDSFIEFIQLYKKVLLFFAIIALTLALLGGIFSTEITEVWITSELSAQLVSNCLVIMFLIIASRYFQGPLRSVLLGKEKHVLLTFIDVMTATISTPIACVVLMNGSGNVIDYFYVQLIASFLRLICLSVFTINTIKATSITLMETPKKAMNKVNTTFSSLLKFGFQLSALSILWIIATQSDKLVLTKVMSLAEYSYYSIAISLVGVVAIISGPVTQFLLPRLTRLHSQGELNGFADIFEKSFSYLATILVPLCLFMFVDGQKLVYVWTNDVQTSLDVQIYLPWLFTGTVIAVFSNHCFLLLYSHGKLRNHTIFYTCFSFVVIFLNILIANEYKGVGASMFFFANSLFVLVTWCFYNFIMYFNGFLIYLTTKILPIVIFSCIGMLVLPSYEFNYRVLSFVGLVIKGGLVVIFNISYLFLYNKIFKCSGFGTLSYKIKYKEH